MTREVQNIDDVTLDNFIKLLQAQKEKLEHAKPFLKAINDANVRLVLKSIAHNKAILFIFQSQLDTYKSKGVSFEYLADLERLLKFSNQEVAGFFSATLFVESISEAELFFSNILKAIVSEYPHKLGNSQFKLSEILNTDSRDELVSKAVDDYLYKMLYKKPAEYIADISSILSIEQSVLTPFWPQFVEAKARRDLGVHNDWICNLTYLRKLKEANVETTAVVGDSLAPIEHKYTSSVFDNFIYMSSAITNSIFAKYS